MAHPPSPAAPAAVAEEPAEYLYYSPIYRDAQFEYRHVIFPESYKSKDIFLSGTIAAPSEFRQLGVVLDPGWQQCCVWRAFRQAPAVIFRRRLGFPADETTALHDPETVVGVDPQVRPVLKIESPPVSKLPVCPPVDSDTLDHILKSWDDMLK